MRRMISSSSLHPLHILLLTQLVAVLILSHLPELTSAQTYQNISLDTTLTTSGTTTSVLSPSGDFAFGFTPLTSNGSTTTTNLFLLAIWFSKTVDKTIVWAANGNNPAPAGSKLSLNSNGQLLLTGPDGETIFSSPASGGSHAAMLDTGNLVLVNANSGSTIWQSFDDPTDTILPTQVLSLNAPDSQLQSRLTSTNYSGGRFTFTLEGDGDVSLRQLASPITANQSYNPYWSTSTSGSGSKLIFDPLGIVYLELTNDTRINITSAGVGSNAAADFYQRATLDFDGVFRHYVYPKSSNGSWTQGWTSQSRVPDDICRAITNDVGSGACGFNSYCQLDGNERVVCQCPSKYSFIDSSNEYRGCMPDFVAQRCDVDDSARFQLVEMVNTDWPLSDYEHYTPVVEDQCRDYCLNDCFCAVAIFRKGDCWKKKLPLSNGKIGSYVGGKALIKVTKDNASNEPWTSPTIAVKKNDRKGLIIVGSSLLGCSVFINILSGVAILFMIFCYPCKRKHPHDQDASKVLEHGLRCFTYEELREATNGFSEELGSGAFSTVYKGVFLNGKARICIAVKKLDKVCQDVQKEFLAEVRSIGQTHHKNLVRLLGYCNKGENRLLVYEFMGNGSLTSFLFGEMKPDWNKRVNIILGVARGLLYLHEECITPIIHCDIKSQNILLDDNLAAKISDFGLAKLLGANQTRTNTGIRGTRGYVAPEWFKSMPISVKVDVYSFGVMLLETICCRKHLEESESENEEAVVLVYWAYDCYRDGRLDILVGSDRQLLFDMRRVERFVMVAIWCIQEDPSLRPTMQKVVLMLEGSVSVPVPPDPSSYMSSIQ